MQIKVSLDTSGLEAKSLREQKRLAYNFAQAQNETLKAVQRAIQAHMTEVFKLRSSTRGDRKWLLQRIKIAFASPRKGVVFGEIYVDQKARLLLAAFETGEQREGFVGKGVAVPNPTEARQGGSFAGAIKPELTFRGMKLKPFTVTPRTRSDSEQFKGANRTFGLKSTAKNPFGGVYERVGPKKDDIRLVYSFRRGMQLHQLLHFIDTAHTVIQDKFAIEWVIANARNPSK